MYQKNCDRCCRSSFSSSESGIWLCPSCKNDLTEYPLLDAMTLEKINVNFLPFQKKMACYENKLS